jgi:hypothetical protein
MRSRIAKKVARRAEQGIGNYSPGKVAKAREMLERGKKRQEKKQQKKAEADQGK